MLVLLVDDNRTFRADVPHVRCRTSAEALAALPLLRAQPGGVLWLDHDLGEVDGHADTTLPVLDELARAAFDGCPYPVSRVVVHTANPVGRRDLMAGLQRWGYPALVLPAGLHLVEEAAERPPRPGETVG